MEASMKTTVLSGDRGSSVVGRVVQAGLPGYAQSDGAATPDHARSHHHYQLIDLGTFGGPNSSLPGSIESLNPSGAVTGGADTSFLDPDFAIQNRILAIPT
jgi:hypothetical protein